MAKIDWESLGSVPFWLNLQKLNYKMMESHWVMFIKILTINQLTTAQLR